MFRLKDIEFSGVPVPETSTLYQSFADPVEPFLKKAKRDTGVYFRSEWLPHIGDKAANARAFQALAASGKVWIPYTDWGDELLNQLVKFIPNTNFKDDTVDVCGLMGRVVDKVFGPQKVIIAPTVTRDSYGFDEEPSENWKTA